MLVERLVVILRKHVLLVSGTLLLLSFRNRWLLEIGSGTQLFQNTGSLEFLLKSF